MKKTMKIIMFVTIICLLFSFSACKNNKGVEVKEPISAFSKYESAWALMEEMDGLDLTMEMTMKMDMSGVSMTIPITMDIQATQKDGELEAMKMTMNMEFMSQKMSMSMYSDGQYMYMDQDGMKIKSAMDSETEESFDMDLSKLTISEDIVKEKKTEQKDGETVYTLVINGEKIQDLMSQLSGLMSGGLMGDSEDLFGSMLGEGGDMTISDVTVSFTVNDAGYMKQTDFAFDINVQTQAATYEGEEISPAMQYKMGMALTIKFNNPGQKVTIVPPSDLDAYEEYDEDYNWDDLFTDEDAV